MTVFPTDPLHAELAKALAWWGDDTAPTTWEEAIRLATSHRNDAHRLADVCFELRNEPNERGFSECEQVRLLLAERDAKRGGK